jgi:hypothetical protein
MQKTGDDVSIMNVVGSPEGVDAANPSSLAHDRSNGNLWLKQSGTGNTGWKLISTNTQDLHTSAFIVSAAGTNGTGANYGSITSAVANASSGDTIFIMPGTYTENLTITKDLNFVAYAATLREPPANVTITGKITVSTASADAYFFGIRFNTNADVSFSLTANGGSVTCQDCYFNALNANSISCTGNTSTNFYMENCSGGLASTFALFTTTNAAVWIKNSTFIDNTTPGTSTTSAGAVRILQSNLSFPIATTSTGAFIIENTSFGGQQSPFTNTTWFTTAGTGSSFIDYSTFNSGTASAISIGVGTTVTAVGLRVNSSNTNAITGAGTILYGPITFSGSSSTINTTTQTALITTLGSLKIKTPISLSAPVPLMRDSVTGEVGVGPVSGLTWTDVTGATQTLAVENGYLTDRAGGVTYTLPATASIGDTIKVVGKLGLATITPNANQQILIGAGSGTVGVTGTAVSINVGDCIELICTTSGASTVWRADSVVGTWILN